MNIYKVKPNKNFIRGVSSITAFTDKERNLKFSDGETIEVNEKELSRMVAMNIVDDPRKKDFKHVDKKLNVNLEEKNV